MRLSRGSCSKCGRFLSLTMCLRGDLIRPHKQDTPQTEPSKALTKHIQNVKDQIQALCTIHHRWALPLFKHREDAVNAQHEHEMGEPSCWIVSRIYCEGICDIAGETKGYDLECCFKHLSILSLSLFFIVCSRNEKGAGGWNRTNRNGSPFAHNGNRCFPCSRRAARKGRPSLRSHSPELPWARSFWLPVKVAYFVPVCKRVCVGVVYSRDNQASPRLAL